MAVPIYDRIYEDLKHKILSGEIKPGDLLPIDADLEKTYGVSRSPVRQALEKLSGDGLILRGAGRRTCVADNIKTYQWVPSTGFRELFEQSWDQMECRTFTVDMMSPPDAGRNFLQLKPGEKALYMQRVRYFFGEPIMLTDSYLPSEYSLQFFKELGDIAGLREVLFQQFGRSYKHVRESLAVRPIPSDAAYLLKVPAGTPMMEIDRFVIDERDMPLLYHRRYAKTDKWRYEVDF